MPELPEVETVVRALRRPLLGRTILSFHNTWARHIALPSPTEVATRIAGHAIQAIHRRAKYIVITLDDGQSLIIHLKMTGHLAVVDPTEPRDKHTHTWFDLDNGQQLRFHDPRKFGRVYLVSDPDTLLGHLGPEPLTAAFTPAVLQAQLRRSRRALKSHLLDQTTLAGVGNIYADEALFAAGLHPTRRSNSLSDEEAARLHHALRQVLQLGIDREGASIDSYVKPDGSKGEMQNAVMVFRRTGAPCYTCGTPIVRIVLGQRSTHFCPTCQPSPQTSAAAP